MGRIRTSTQAEELANCDLVIEAVAEDLPLKQQLHAQLGRLLKPSAVLATNTSSFRVSQMAEASGRPQRMVGLHFFNPVQLMGLVEVVRTERTEPAVFQQMMDFVRLLGKTPVACLDTPGFVVNRLLVPYMSQAMLMLDRQDASRDDIDNAMRLGAGHPMGPIHLADYVGLDTCLSILEGWTRDFPNEPAFQIPNCLRQKVGQGHFGRKSGQGFYRWQNDKIVG
jgi:3-hydroxyacyl-CoA dehydrogenase